MSRVYKLKIFRRIRIGVEYINFKYLEELELE